MRGRRAPTAVVLAMVICGLVVAAALTGAAVLRVRTNPAAAAPLTTSSASTNPRAGECKREPCKRLGQVPVAGTDVQLIGDSGAASGRLLIGSPGSPQIIEITVTDLGVKLTESSLQCAAGAVAACIVRGVGDKGTTGQVIAGRSDKWSPLGRAFFSAANYLSLANVVGDSSPEVITVQRDCRTGEDCQRQVYVQVFGLGGEELGCTKTYSRMDQLPGYPEIVPTEIQLRGCP
ncbi:hypothetical protein [Actinokineospora auranticolor]|uniref:hypothetical protein n=1 Tax=Actinokineospora auranticolor TaxID=155976 RepID=UPI0011B06188|nr:hypothetical protein [Actinokineospora auranticolor]